jgi:transposase-like protein
MVSTWPSWAGWEPRLVLQRVVDEEVAAFLGRARYERTSTATGSRNGTRPKPIQTAEGEISIAMPQVRNAAERFVSQVIPDTRAVVRTRPLEALIIGSYVRGLSDRDIESLAEEAELGHVSKSTVEQRQVGGFQAQVLVGLITAAISAATSVRSTSSGGQR